jgi:dipeptidase E
LHTVLFIPYARPSGISHEEYSKGCFSFRQNKHSGKRNEFDDAVSAVENAEGILQEEEHFVLVSELYKNNIMNALAAVKKEPLPRNKCRKRYLRAKHANH